MEYSELNDHEQLYVTAIRFFTPVTGLAAFFGSVPPKAELKKCAAYFFKEAKTAAFRLRSPPAVEAKVAN